MADRRIVSAFLGVWLAVLAVDAFRPLVGAQRQIDDAIHPALDIAGLRQWPWRLFAEVPRVNLRFSATLEFADGATAHWESPEWNDIGALGKLTRMRELNYFRNLNLFDDDSFPLVAGGLCAYLARTVPHPQGKPGAARAVTLFLRGARIPDIEERIVPAAPFAEFDKPIPIFPWRAP